MLAAPGGELGGGDQLGDAAAFGSLDGLWLRLLRHSGRRARGAGEHDAEGGDEAKARGHAVTCVRTRLRAAKLALSAQGFKRAQ